LPVVNPLLVLEKIQGDSIEHNGGHVQPFLKQQGQDRQFYFCLLAGDACAVCKKRVAGQTRFVERTGSVEPWGGLDLDIPGDLQLLSCFFFDQLNELILIIVGVENDRKSQYQHVNGYAQNKEKAYNPSHKGDHVFSL